MKIVTSIGLFNDAVGKRMSITYSEVDENGRVISDNNRVDRVVVDRTVINLADEIADYAQEYIDTEK